MKTITVRVPATSANCGPGFDCLGLALHIYNTFTFEEREEKGFTFTFEGEGAHLLKDETEDTSLVFKAMKKVLAPKGIELKGGHLHSSMSIPPSRGLGSSSTAIVAGLYIGNAFLEEPLSKEELLTLATEMEGHPDNVCPAIFGSLCCASYEEGKVYYNVLPLPEELTFAVVIPEVIVPTVKARAALPDHLSYKATVHNISHTALLVSSLILKDWTTLGVALEDEIHVPYRKALIPHCEEVFQVAKEAGAMGATISGSGSTLIAYCKENGASIAEKMKAVFTRNGIEAKAFEIRAEIEGAQYK